MDESNEGGACFVVIGMNSRGEYDHRVEGN